MEDSHQITVDTHQLEVHKGGMANSARDQFRGAPNGVDLGALMSGDFYPVEDGDTQQTVRTSISLTQQQLQDIHAIAEFWNGLDKILKRPRRRKWTAASVISRFLTKGIDGFWAQAGGRPAGDPKEFLARAAENIRKPNKK